MIHSLRDRDVVTPHFISRRGPRRFFAGRRVVAVLLRLTSAWAADSAPPKLFLIGGSTMATFPEMRPVVGWGQKLPQFFRDSGAGRQPREKRTQQQEFHRIVVTREVAARERVPLMEMRGATVALEQSLGPARTLK